MKNDFDDIKLWCEGAFVEHKALLKTLAAIPAPSNDEGRRARFILDRLESEGARGAYIDDSGNVVLPFCCEGKNDIRVFMAHTDVVFSDTEALPVDERDGRICAPGVGDDTANVASLLLIIRYILKNKLTPRGGVLFVFDTGEEGLGNLRGVRGICRDFSGRIKELISFDGGLDHIATKAVGSERWRVEIRTEGGHSYSAFGNKNAIRFMASLIDTLYTLDVPQKSGTKTTYNVGLISGGTSVNTIADEASMLYEYRSDDAECLAFMRKAFLAVTDAYRAMGVDISAELIGERPCMGGVDTAAINTLYTRCADAVFAVTGAYPPAATASTDANIPYSLGIPAVTFGLYRGDGAHTRNEWVDAASLTEGLRVGLSLVLEGFGE